MLPTKMIFLESKTELCGKQQRFRVKWSLIPTFRSLSQTGCSIFVYLDKGNQNIGLAVGGPPDCLADGREADGRDADGM